MGVVNMRLRNMVMDRNDESEQGPHTCICHIVGEFIETRLIGKTYLSNIRKESPQISRMRRLSILFLRLVQFTHFYLGVTNCTGTNFGRYI